jgi:hypothetical protein
LGSVPVVYQFEDLKRQPETLVQVPFPAWASRDHPLAAVEQTTSLQSSQGIIQYATNSQGIVFQLACDNMVADSNRSPA